MTTKIPAKIRVIVLGDSQAVKLAYALSMQGYPVLSLAKSGSSTLQSLSRFLSSESVITSFLAQPPSNTPTVVLASTGGNDLGLPLKSAVSAYDKFIEAIVDTGIPHAILLPPPARQIADVPLAKKVFGPKVSGPSYWFDSGYAEKRQSLISAYAKVAASRPRAAVGWWWLDPERSPPDGIHASPVEAARTAEAAITAAALGTGTGTVMGGGVGTIAALAVLALVCYSLWQKTGEGDNNAT